MTAITTHILDTSLGKPASGVPVILEQETQHGWQVIAEALTDEDGRVKQWDANGLPIGHYRLTAKIGVWFQATERQSMYQQSQIDFVTADGEAHYHLPFLISPWSWSTYRGS